jgi:hypothetical protein
MVWSIGPNIFLRTELASPPKLFLWISRTLSRQPRIADFKSSPSTSWQGEHHGCIRKNVPWIGTNGICYFGCRDLDIGCRETEGAAQLAAFSFRSAHASRHYFSGSLNRFIVNSMFRDLRETLGQPDDLHGCSICSKPEVWPRSSRAPPAQGNQNQQGNRNPPKGSCPLLLVHQCFNYCRDAEETKRNVDADVYCETRFHC